MSESPTAAEHRAVDVATLDRELSEIEMLIAQAGQEASRHEQRRSQAADKFAALADAGFPREYLINDKVFAKPSVANRVLKEFRELAVYGQEAAPIFAPLSPREVEILDNIAQGMTNKQVAYALSISEQTVKNHMSSILRKLSVNDRTQAVVYAMRQGWIRMPED